MHKVRQHSLLIATIVTLSGCNAVELPNISDNLPFSKKSTSQETMPAGQASPLALGDMIGSAPARVDMSKGFNAIMAQAIDNDPGVIGALNESKAKAAALRITQTGKDYSFDATVLGGVEDVTDEVAGVAAILKASRLLYDGGQLNAKIEADEFASKAALSAYEAKRNERGAQLATSWIELERYQALQGLIDSRLGVLDPLMKQLEQVANSGMGDVSQVAAAQRTVSMIRVTQTDVAEKYAQARVAFTNGFGALPKSAGYDSGKISKAVPRGKTSALAEKAPALLAKYYAYRAAEANVAAIKGLDNVNVSFEAKVQKPFGNSDFASDESIGVVLTKKFYRGDQLKSRVDNAEAAAAAAADSVRSAYRDGEQAVLAARQMITSMDTAIGLARQNAQITRDEIDYLRKQLIIGGSTLDAVLSAEARLYEAESKEIGFIAERRKAEIAILAATGRLVAAIGM